jgi:hypothetical protein
VVRTHEEGWRPFEGCRVVPKEVDKGKFNAGTLSL